MKDGFSMKLIDVVNDTEFKHILKQTVSRYMDVHYKSVGTSVKRDDRLKRTPSIVKPFSNDRQRNIDSDTIRCQGGTGMGA